MCRILATLLVLMLSSGCGREKAIQPGIDSGAESATAATYRGHPVTAAWVEGQYSEFREKLFRADGKVVNILETNFLEGGQPLTDGEMRSPGGSYAPLSPGEVEGRIFKISACGLGGDFHVVNFGCNAFFLRCPDNATFQRKIGGAFYYQKDKKKRQPFYVRCVKGGWLLPPGQGVADSGNREIPEMVFAEPLTRQEFVEFLNSGQPLISGFREISEQEAKGMKKTDFSVFTKDAVVKRAVALVVPVPAQ